MREIWDSKEFIQKQSEASKIRWQNKDYRDHIIQRTTELWLDASYRDRQGVALSEALKRREPTKPHKKVIEILKSLGIRFEIEHPIGPWPFDIFIPDHNLLIEIQGDYWHNKTDKIIRDKQRSTYIDQYFPNYQLKYIWEHECLQENKILEKLKYWLGLTRLELVEYNIQDIEIRFIDQKDADTFLYNWHYIHHGRHGVDFGGYLNDELIVIARFTSPHRQEIATSMGYDPREVLELSRLCVHPRYQKKNLLSWFLSKVEKLPIKQSPNTRCLVSFADTSYGHTGAIYKASNWTLHSKVLPDYHYVSNDGWVMHKKTLWNQAKKMKMIESEYAANKGFHKVWGKEKLKFIKRF